MATCSTCLCFRIMKMKSRNIAMCNYFLVPSRTAFWSRKKKEVQLDEPREIKMDNNEPTTIDRFQSLKKRTSVQTVRGYSPPADVESRIQQVTEQVCGPVPNWREVSLEDKYLKFKLLTKFIKEFDHDIPNMDLNDMKTVHNAVEHFKTEVRDTCSYEDLSKLDLPKNLHINVEPIRFDPDNDPLFGGKTAFPGRPTIVSSIKYRRKYKGSHNRIDN